jgi:predicted DsbA family dithiol-disulfide isomerase
MEYYNSKFGPNMVATMIPKMRNVAQEYDIELKYDGYVGNTFNSHRLIWKAWEVGGSELQDKVVNMLFKAYFEENKSLGELTVLEECGKDAGLDEQLLHEFLSNAKLGTTEVRQEMQEYGRAFQCTGVPMFIVDGTVKLSGAQEPNSFIRLFESL